MPRCRYVLWPRVDQKTCLKSITAAGFEVLPIPLRRAEGADELTTDIDAIRQRLEELGTEQVGRRCCQEPLTAVPQLAAKTQGRSLPLLWWAFHTSASLRLTIFWPADGAGCRWPAL